MMHRTIKKVGADIEALRFNTAIAELIKLNNELTGATQVSRELAERLHVDARPLRSRTWRKSCGPSSATTRPSPAGRGRATTRRS